MKDTLLHNVREQAGGPRFLTLAWPHPLFLPTMINFTNFLTQRSSGSYMDFEATVGACGGGVEVRGKGPAELQQSQCCGH